MTRAPGATSPPGSAPALPVRHARPKLHVVMGGEPDQPARQFRQGNVLRTRLMRSLKYLLPILAVAMAVGIVIWSQANLPVIRLRISDSAVAPNDVPSLSMVNPRFAGIDAHDRQYDVTAVTATQSPDNEDILHLQQPRANIIMEDGTPVQIDADSGVYQRADKLLDLSGAVTLHDPRGYEFHTSRAHVDLDKNVASGDAPVDGTMPDGTLEGEGFRIEDNGARLFLLGRSQVILQSAGGENEGAGQ